MHTSNIYRLSFAPRTYICCLTSPVAYEVGFHALECSSDRAIAY